MKTSSTAPTSRRVFSVADITEKTRLALQMIGKMLFAQTSEIINPHTSNGLPANLVADDASLSYCMKGVDVNMADYQSELAFLANPVSSHVQSAEMHNQSFNSLALISLRYAMQAVELVSLMAATSFYAACQTLDLRVMHSIFLESFDNQATTIAAEFLDNQIPATALAHLTEQTRCQLTANWHKTGTLDLRERCRSAASGTTALISHLPLPSTLY